MMVRTSTSSATATRKPNLREAILAAAEELFATNGFNAVSIRDIAQAAGANPGSVTYHFKTKDGLLLEIYRRHCGPMNRRRSELLAAARRVRDQQDRLEAIVRAYVLPAFSSGSDLRRRSAFYAAAFISARFEVARRIIRRPSTIPVMPSRCTVHESLPHIPRESSGAVASCSEPLLPLVTPQRVSHSRGNADGATQEAIEQLVRAAVACFKRPRLISRHHHGIELQHNKT
jgi:AcrR family transcriptional regulator